MDFIKASVTEASIVYDELFVPFCHITVVDPNNPEPVQIGLDLESTRLTMVGAMRYLVEMGDPIAKDMFSLFLSKIEKQQNKEEM